MSLDELNEIFGNNNLSYSTIGMAALTNIMKFVEVRLQMDRQSFDYYYEINLNELIDSKMPKEELETLKNQGWSFDKDRKKLILYLTI